MSIEMAQEAVEYHEVQLRRAKRALEVEKEKRRQDAEASFRYGDRFVVHSDVDDSFEVYMLCQVGPGIGQMLAVQDGNRWSDRTIELGRGIIGADISYLVEGADWEYAGTIRQPGFTDEDYDQCAWRMD